MAISATFTANFSKFYEAVDKAVVKIGDFDEAAAKVGPRLDAMVKKFSGEKLIQDAALMIKAIDAIGGSSALTAKQLQELGAQAREASEKMKAMGVKESTKDLDDLADKAKRAADEAAKLNGRGVKDIGDAAKPAGDGLSKFGGIAKNVAGAVGIGFGINAVVAFAKSVQDTIGQIENLHDATGVSRDALQRFAYVGSSAGVSMDEIGKAVGGLSTRLASGDDSAAAAVQKLGLNIKTLIAAGPEEAFLEIGEAVNQIEDPMLKNAIAAGLFGDKLARQLIPMLGNLRTEFENVPDTAIIDDEDIRKAEEFSAMLGHLAIKVKSYAASLLSLGSNRGAGRLVNGQTYQDDFTGPLPESTAQANAKWWTIPQNLGPNSGKDIDLLADSIANVGAQTEKVITKSDILNNRLKALRADAVVPLTKSQQDQARELLAYGVSEKETAELTETTEKAIHLFSEALKAGETQTKKSAAELDAYNKKWVAANRDVTAAAGGLFTALDTLSTGYQQVIRDALKGGASVDSIATAWNLEKEQVQAVADAITLLSSVRALENSAQIATMDTLGKLGVVRDDEIKKLKDQFDVQSKIRGIENTQPNAGDLSKVGTPAFPVPPGTLEKLGQGMGDKVQAGFGKGLQDLPGNILGAIQGGGSIGGTIGSTMGSAVGGSIAESLTKSVTKNIGSGVAGSLLKGVAGMIPVIGAMAGPMIDLAIGGINKLIGNDEEKKTVNPLRDKLIAAAGGLGALNEQASKAGVSLDSLLKADTADEYTAAVEGLNAAFKFQGEALASVNDAAARYGFTIEELGPAMQRQQLDQQAQQLFKDYEVLNAAGIDQVAILNRMGAATSDYVNNALRMGSEIPTAMRPMLEAMAEAGTLTDANGEKITNLDDAGIKFSLTMTEGFNALIKSVDKLADVIGKTLGTAIDDTSKKINAIPKNVDVAVNYKTTGSAKTPEGPDLEGFARGTEGYRNFGAGTPVMLHGWEAVVPMGQSTGEKHAAAAAAEGAIVINVNAQGAFFDTPESMRQMAEKITQALTQKHAMTNKMRAA